MSMCTRYSTRGGHMHMHMHMRMRMRMHMHMHMLHACYMHVIHMYTRRCELACGRVEGRDLAGRDAGEDHHGAAGAVGGGSTHQRPRVPASE
jgi:hypothetical protein